MIEDDEWDLHISEDEIRELRESFRVEIEVIVVGYPTTFTVSRNSSASDVIEKALVKTHYSPKYANKWQLRDMEGVILEPAAPITGRRKFTLNPRPGVWA